MTEISEKIKNKIVVVMTDIKEGIASRLAEYCGIKEKDLPVLTILDTRNEFKKYKLKGEISYDNVIKFIKDWEENKLKRSLKSEKEPKNNNGNVFIIVGKNFEKEVINNDKDVMVLFYAPWCNHCKEFMPKYEEAARILKKNNKNDKLILAKIDGSSNEIEQVIIKGFPTILFFPGNKKKENPIEYKGKRTTKDVIKFIKEHSFHKIEIDDDNDKEKEKNGKVKENNINSEL